jgi:hypothetical protein
MSSLGDIIPVIINVSASIAIVAGLSGAFVGINSIFIRKNRRGSQIVETSRSSYDSLQMERIELLERQAQLDKKQEELSNWQEKLTQQESTLAYQQKERDELLKERAQLNKKQKELSIWQKKLNKKDSTLADLQRRMTQQGRELRQQMILKGSEKGAVLFRMKSRTYKTPGVILPCSKCSKRGNLGQLRPTMSKTDLAPEKGTELSEIPQDRGDK